MSGELFMTVDGEGMLTAIHSPELDEIMGEGESTKRRASHVEPVNPILRAGFRALRAHTSDTGLVAAFTRRWPCAWQADLAPSAGPVLGPFAVRSQAIAAEIEWLKGALSA